MNVLTCAPRRLNNVWKRKVENRLLWPAPGRVNRGKRWQTFAKHENQLIGRQEKISRGHN
jgi:hypothetical protein